ncbi:MAG: DNA adenine methylase [Gemmatimonadaceae bacterium]
MRYIGNKTRLLPFILSAIERFGIKPGVAHDAFAGTASVGQALKASGWRVASSDIMTYSYVFQRAYVVASGTTHCRHLRDGDEHFRRATSQPRFREAVAARGGGALAAMAQYLSECCDSDNAFITEHFSPAGRGERMYFTHRNARRIDAVRATIERWRVEDLIDDDTYFVLLAAVIEAADKVANTAGVYAAYMKTWQPNARRAFHLSPQVPLKGRPGSTAHLGDAAAVARELGSVDLLYVDPPYNTRQYSGYYHVPEIIARGWFKERPVLAGKTGLLSRDNAARANAADKNGHRREQQSAWCSRRTVADSLRELLAATEARHILVSYNTEGLLGSEQVSETLANAAKDGRVERFEKHYRRYRADRDREGRRYSGDSVAELLYYARLRK